MATVLITGANRGIGLALTKQYLERGDTVFAACRDPGAATDLKTLEAEAGPRLEIFALDVTDGESIAAAKAAVGSRPVDILINNAGIMGPKRQSTLDMDFEGFLDVLDVNALGPLRVAQAFLSNLKAAKAGKILTISSQMGAFHFFTGDRIAYRTSKTAVNKIMQGLAADLKSEGIAVVVAHPGWVQTDMGGGSADITPAESAGGLIKLIDNLTLAETGSFKKWNGETHPW